VGLRHFGAAALAYNGPWSYSAIVPWNGPWISGLEPASGSTQKNYTTTIGGSYSGDMNGQIVNSDDSNMSASDVLYNYSWSYYNSGAYAGQNITFKIFGDWWVPVNVQVNGQWYS